MLIAKTFKAAEKYQIKNIAIAGGVSANSRIRNQFKIECEKEIINYLFHKFRIAPTMPQ